MQNFIANQSFKPPAATSYEETADGDEFSQLMSANPFHHSRKSAGRPAYEPGKYATLPTPSIGGNRRPLGGAAGKSSSVERSDELASNYSEMHGSSALLLTGYDGKPVLLEEPDGKRVWNPRASMAFDNAKGLLNPLGQNNCFLNSAVQVLWHLDVFRRNFRILSGHGCVQNACIFCALKVIFTQFQFSDHKVLPSDVLREALAESFANERRFELGRMNDASECFETILQRIHFHLAWNQSEETCQVPHCIPHQKFAMLLVEQMVCACNASDEPLIFNQLVYHVSTSAIISYLRLARLGTSSTDEIASFGQLLCRAKNSGETRRCSSKCGGLIETRQTLANTPEVISIGFIWDSDHPSRSHIRKVIRCISTELRPSDLVYSVVDEDWGQTTTLRLVALVCYHGKHYSTFVFHSKMLTWILFDDARVREIGPTWEMLMDLCVAGLYQPLLMIYADPNGRPIDSTAAPARNISLEREPYGIVEDTEHGDGISEATTNQNKANCAGRCSTRRDLLFGGDCAATKAGSAGVCSQLSPDFQHIVKIQEIPQIQSRETMSLTRDHISKKHSTDSTKRNNGDFVALNHSSFHKTGYFPQDNAVGQQAIAVKKTAGNSSASTDDLKNSCSLYPHQVFDARPCASVADGTHGSTVLGNLVPSANRSKTVQFSHQGVGVSPGGTVESFTISDVEQSPRFHEEFARKINLSRSADPLSNSLQLENTDSNEIGRRSSGDGDCVRGGSLDTRDKFQAVETSVHEFNPGSSQRDGHSTDERKGSGVYIDAITVRSVLSSQGVNRLRLATPGGAPECSRSTQILKKTTDTMGNHDDISGNRKSTEIKPKSQPNTNVKRLPLGRAQRLRNFSSEEWNTGNDHPDKAEFKDKKHTEGQQLLLYNRTSSAKPAVSKPGATSKHSARTSKLQSNSEFSPAGLTPVSETVATSASTPAVTPSVSTKLSLSNVPHSVVATGVNSIPSTSVDASQGFNTFPRRNRNIESQPSNPISFGRSLNSSQSSWSKDGNRSSEYDTHERTTSEHKSTSEPKSTIDNNGNVYQLAKQISDGISSDGGGIPTGKCRTLLSSPPLDSQVTDWQTSSVGGSDDVVFNDRLCVSRDSKIQLFRNALQLLKSCDEYVMLSSAELNMGNEKLAAGHCSMASALLADAFHPCQLDNDLEFLFHSTQRNVQKCQNNLQRYLAHFSDNNEANEEYSRPLGSKQNMESVFYLSGYIPSQQVQQKDMTKSGLVDECQISSSDIFSRVSATEDGEAISKCRLRPTVNLTRDPSINRKIVHASKVISSPEWNLSGVNSNVNDAETVRSVSTNGKFPNSARDCKSSSSSLSENVTSLALSNTMSIPRKGVSVSSSMSLPRNRTVVSSSVSLLRNNTSVSSSMSLPRSNTGGVSSSMSLPRSNTGGVSSSKSLRRNNTGVSSSLSLARNSTNASSPLNETSSSSFSAKGTSVPLCIQDAALPVSTHKQLPKSWISCEAGNTDNSENMCRTHTDSLTDRRPLKGYSNSNNHEFCSGNSHILDETCGRTSVERCRSTFSSTTVPSLVEPTFESFNWTRPDARHAGLSLWDSTLWEASVLQSMSQKLQKLEKQNREMRDRMLNENNVLWS